MIVANFKERLLDSFICSTTGCGLRLSAWLVLLSRYQGDRRTIRSIPGGYTGLLVSWLAVYLDIS